MFCKNCLQGFHIGECLPENNSLNDTSNCEYSVNPERAAVARWDEASQVTIKIITKPCPKCRTPTERAGDYPLTIIMKIVSIIKILNISSNRWLYAYGLYARQLRL